MNSPLKNIQTIFVFTKASLTSCAVLFCLLATLFSYSQVTTELDTTKIRIGEQITYKILVETDSTNNVVFPEGQTFLPLELVEALTIDTTKSASKLKLLRAYKITQFDSGSYYIPRQKIIIGDKPFFTDSLKVDVNTVQIDTTKQGLYDIKPIVTVEKSPSYLWLYILLIILAIALIAFLLFWFIWRKKPLTEEQKIALLPPYERAKLAISKLEEKKYLERLEIKEFYSDLTFIIRKFLDEKVYDRSLESTTDQLIERLQLLRDSNQFKFQKETLSNIETILKRADLVKFAKSEPDVVLAEMDKQTIDKEIDAVKNTLPEPTEEEKLLDQNYKLQKERKEKRKKILLTIAISAFIILATFITLGATFGFTYVKDKIIGHKSIELLESKWVKSAYGYPPIYIETPKVLRREKIKIKDSLGADKDSQFSGFVYGSKLSDFYMIARSVPVKQQDLAKYFVVNKIISEEELKDLDQSKFKKIIIDYFSEVFTQEFQNLGAKDIVSLKKEYKTQQEDIEGSIAYGSLIATNKISGRELKFQYSIYTFYENNAVEVLMFMYKEDDIYISEVIDRILNSIRFNPNAKKEEETK